MSTQGTVREVKSSVMSGEAQFRRWRAQWEAEFFAPLAQEAMVAMLAQVLYSMAQGPERNV